MTAQLFEKVLAFFLLVVKLENFCGGSTHEYAALVQKSLQNSKKNWDTLLCIALVSVTAQLFAPTTAHHPQA